MNAVKTTSVLFSQLPVTVPFGQLYRSGAVVHAVIVLRMANSAR